MSSATIRGMAPLSLIAGPDFRAGQDDTGLWTGSMMLCCKTSEYARLTSKIKSGTAYSLNEKLGPDWNFLKVKAFDGQHEAGGLTRVKVDFSGVQPSSTADFDSGIASYQMSGVATEMDIILHPKVQKDPSIKGLTALFNGSGVVKKFSGGMGEIVVVNANDSEDIIETITNLEWYDEIFTKGNRTWLAPTLEWTKSGSIKGVLTKSKSKVEKLGFIDIPDGNPATPTDRDWLLVGVDEGREVGEGSTYSYKWQLSPPGKKWPTLIYTK